MPSFRLRALVLAAGLLATLSGCASIDPLGRRSDFDDIQRNFTQYIRWGKFKEASQLLEPELRSDFLDLAPQLSDLRFTDFEILDVDLDQKTLAKATVEVRFEGYNLSSPVQKSVTLKQTWKKDESGAWRVALDLDKLRSGLLGSTTQ